MIIDNIRNDRRYYTVDPRFIDAFSFLKRGDLAHLPDGRYDIDGARIYATISRMAGKGRGGTLLESHRKYIDIQFAVTGTDVVGWKEREKCGRIREAYDSRKDCVVYDDEADSWIVLSPGTFIVFFPDDAHAPCGGAGDLHKVVLKVALG